LACWLHWRFQLRLLQDHTVMAIGAGMAAADMAAGMEAMAAGMVGTAGMAGMAAGMAIPAGMAVAAIGMAAGGDMASARAGVGIFSFSTRRFAHESARNFLKAEKRREWRRTRNRAAPRASVSQWPPAPRELARQQSIN
jgi:hypothetical protein